MANRSKTLIEACRDIVKHSQHAKYHGLHIDGFTASMFVQVYDSLNETNRAKIDALAAKSPGATLMLCWKLVNKK